MSFWSSQRILERHRKSWLIGTGAGAALDLQPTSVREANYVLHVGPECFVTSFEKAQKQQLGDKEQLEIPPGQFAILITEEQVRVPADAIGFISIRARAKFRGLLNVSGFHVDPGFQGRLLFSVYNAGTKVVTVERGEALFPIWFCDLVSETGVPGPDAHPYNNNGEHWGQTSISSEAVMRIQGEVASPGQLKRELDSLRRTVRWSIAIATVVLGIILAPVATYYFDKFAAILHASRNADNVSAGHGTGTEHVDGGQ